MAETKTSKAGAVVKLDYPFQLDGRSIERLTMRRPKVEDLRQAARQGGDDLEERELVLFSRLCDINPEDLAMNLDVADWHELQKAYDGFLSPSPGPRPGEAASG